MELCQQRNLSAHTYDEATVLEIVAAVVTTYLGGFAAFPAIEQATLYDSRALGRHRPGSGIDLTLSGVDLDPRTLARLDAALLV